MVPADAAGYMPAALEQAVLALNCGEVPVGCIIVNNGIVVSSGYNLTNTLKNVSYKLYVYKNTFNNSHH